MEIYKAIFTVTGDLIVHFATDKKDPQHLKHVARELLYGCDFNYLKDTDCDLIEIIDSSTGETIWEKDNK